MTTATEFLLAFKNRPASAWESAAVDMARRGDFLAWPLLPVTFTDGVRTCVVRMACDAFAIGTAADYMRLPLTPLPMQRIADGLGMCLPTKKMATERWRQASCKLTPIPLAPNKGADLAQYLAHSRAIDQQLASFHGTPGIVAGTKKAVVVGRLWSPKCVVVNGVGFDPVLIWGLFWPDDPTIHGPYMTDNLRASQPIQPYSNAHADFYVDYSHGLFLCEATCRLDGVERRVADVLQDPSTASLLSDEGPLARTQVRYPAGPVVQAAIPYSLIPEGGVRDPADRGLNRVRADVLEEKTKT